MTERRKWLSILASLIFWNAISGAFAFTPSSTRTIAGISRPINIQRASRTFLASASAVLDKSAKVDDTASTSPSPISLQRPKGAQNAWEVHKFGGASLATAELYRTVGDLLLQEAAGRGSGSIPTMAVVSARGGMTDLLGTFYTERFSQTFLVNSTLL